MLNRTETLPVSGDSTTVTRRKTLTSLHRLIVLLVTVWGLEKHQLNDALLCDVTDLQELRGGARWSEVWR